MKFGLVLCSIMLAPTVVWATSPEYCGDCTVYESYCLVDNGVVGVDLECPELPSGPPGSDMEPIACSFVMNDATVEGTCSWSALEMVDSDSCLGDQSFGNLYAECEGVSSDGELLSGLCTEYPCSGGGDSGPFGCQAFGVSQIGSLLLLAAFFSRRRRD